jgi:ABC-type multidrug transport system fused ATPase/permease subunit
LKKLLSFILNFNKKTRLVFFGIIFLNIFASLAEIISIGAVIPFLGLLVDPDSIKSFTFLPLSFSLDILSISFLFITSILLSSLLRVFNLYLTTQFSFKTASDLSLRMYENFLSKPFLEIKNFSSNHIVDLILNKSNQLSMSVMMLMNVISSSIISIGIIFFLVFINPFLAFVIFGLCSIFYLFFTWLGKKHLVKFSENTARESNNLTRHLEEGYGLIREIKTADLYKVFFNRFSISDKLMRRSMGMTQFLSQYPRFFIEGFIVVGLIILINILLNNNLYDSSLIGLIGGFIFGMQRLLPVVQNAYGSYSNIKGYQDSIDACLFFLSDSFKRKNKVLIDFQSLSIKNLSFKTAETNIQIFENLTFNLKKGDCVAILGKSGTGKTTLIEILLGLITPQKMDLFINNKKYNYQYESDNVFFYIPQHTFLFSGSISQNIALEFDTKKIDNKKIKRILSDVDLDDLNPKKMISHRGENVSVGQAQRIGIARAIYANKQILIMDEPTSALDKKTEEKFIKLLSRIKEQSTIIMATHKIEPLKVCNKIFRIRNKKIEKFNPF